MDSVRMARRRSTLPPELFATKGEAGMAARRRGIRIFHAFVIAGGLVNAAVVIVLVAYWLAH